MKRFLAVILLVAATGCAPARTESVLDYGIRKDIPSNFNMPGTLNRVTRDSKKNVVSLHEMCRIDRVDLRKRLEEDRSRVPEEEIDNAERNEVGINSTIEKIISLEAGADSNVKIKREIKNSYKEALSIGELDTMLYGFLSESSVCRQSILNAIEDGDELCQVEAAIIADVRYELVSDLNFSAKAELAEKLEKFLETSGHGEFVRNGTTIQSSQGLYHTVWLRPVPRQGPGSESRCSLERYTPESVFSGPGAVSG